MAVNISKEVRLGLLVTAAVAVLIWGLSFLKGHNLFRSYQEYFAQYDRIDGLVESNPVVLNGYKVGTVSGIEFHPQMPGKLVVRFTVSGNSLRLPRDTRARIYSSDLMGSKAIELVLGSDASALLENGDTLSSEIEESLREAVNKQIAPLRKKTEELVSSIDSAVTIVQEILNNQARENLGRSFESIRRSFETFESAATDFNEMMGQNKERISDILIKIQNITTVFNNNSEQLVNVINNFSAISDSVAQADFATALKNVNAALNSVAGVMQRINRGEGTLGLLLNDEKLYHELTLAATDLNILLLDMRLNPGKYAPLKRRRGEKELERDSIWYRNMMRMDSALIHRR